ncbi:MAG: hypothetical protein WAU47_04575, partial [Desulfobaccales bacterium]
MKVYSAPDRGGRPPGIQVYALILGWVLLLLAWPTPLKAAKPASPTLPTLRSFNIIGAETIKPRKLKKQMSMPLPSRVPIKRKPVFKKGDLEADIEQLKL